MTYISISAIPQAITRIAFSVNAGNYAHDTCATCLRAPYVFTQDGITMQRCGCGVSVVPRKIADAPTFPMPICERCGESFAPKYWNPHKKCQAKFCRDCLKAKRAPAGRGHTRQLVFGKGRAA